MIFPFVSVIRDGKTILSAVLFEVDENLTFEDLLYQADSDYVSEEVVRVDIQVRGTNIWHMVASGLNGCLRMSKKCLPNSKPSTNRNDQLYNDILELLRSKNLGWEYGTQNSLGVAFINKLVSLLYYLDDKHKTLKLRSLKIPSIFFQLPLYQQNSYYKNGTHHKTTLRRKELELHADKLEECVLQPWASKPSWNEIITATLELCSVARTYAKYLETVNLHVQRIQSSSAPARSPEKDSVLEMRSLSQKKFIPSNNNDSEEEGNG
ncbi:9209_t:CDS:2 [Dentiscutata erythropus]|uniref:9209_t:CDS:1 n=1 Tax=Dentiscutata erythropus TaxID=1348616 RepID=A0A9N9IAC2_9GLOM|nr:9209_t:CDS:2 [Dentiscutata erythropus]